MTHRIGDITRQLGLSADTLRYYEKIGLLKQITRVGHIGVPIGVSGATTVIPARVSTPPTSCNTKPAA